MTELQKLKKDLEDLPIVSQTHFLKMILDSHIPYTENKNGTFINISELTTEQTQKIIDFVNTIMSQEKSFNSVENQKKLLKQLINSDMEESQIFENSH